MLVIIVAICGRMFGAEAVRGQVYWEIKDLVGDQAADIVQTLLKAAHRPGASVFATFIGFVVLLFGASGIFAELRDTLNFIWDAPPSAPASFWSVISYRVFAFAMVSAAGVLLLLSLVLSAVLQGAGTYAARYITIPPLLIEAGNSAAVFVAVSFVFALIYKTIPEVPIDWADVGLGAGITGALFVAGKFVLALYLGKAGVGSPYGAAGSLIVLLVWVFYSSQIFLYGAEFTYVYARRRDSPAIKRANVDPGINAGIRTK